MNGGSGIDNLDYLGSTAGVTIDLQNNTASGGDAAGDTIASFENVSGTPFNDIVRGSAVANLLQGGAGDDLLVGRNGDDFLRGLAGDDTLRGDAGEDRLAGGLGVDELEGGADADRYLFEYVSEIGLAAGTRDVIAGFEQGVDRIDLTSIDASTAVAGNQAFTFIGSAAFTAEGQVRVTQSGGNTLVALNVTGDGTADARIELSGLHTLAATDFTL